MNNYKFYAIIHIAGEESITFKITEYIDIFGSINKEISKKNLSLNSIDRIVLSMGTPNVTDNSTKYTYKNLLVGEFKAVTDLDIVETIKNFTNQMLAEVIRYM